MKTPSTEFAEALVEALSTWAPPNDSACIQCGIDCALDPRCPNHPKLVAYLADHIDDLLGDEELEVTFEGPVPREIVEEIGATVRKVQDAAEAYAKGVERTARSVLAATYSNSAITAKLEEAGRKMQEDGVDLDTVIRRQRALLAFSAISAAEELHNQLSARGY